MADLKQFDTYLKPTGPAAVVLREELVPVEGADSVFFPATFAQGDGFEGGYNIDSPPGAPSVCLVDTVGSQANRIEPLFATPPYMELIPQIVVKAGTKDINLVSAGHRAGDALVRCSALQDRLSAAFRALQTGDASPLAKLAPTSLVFGVWDSRETQAKAPRIVASTIRAYDVIRLRRSAQFVPATEYEADGLLPEATDVAAKKAYSERGFQHVPATGTHGGVVARAGIRREASLSVAALRLLNAGKDELKTRALQRYVLGLAMTAFTAPIPSYLRQGCNLVPDSTKGEARHLQEVLPTGERRPFAVSHEEALAFARLAAADFGVGPSETVEFDKERAKRDVAGDEKKGKKKAK